MQDAAQSRPLITLGLTAYNAADTIAAALASMLAQDWDPIEVVAVDDASTDGTPDILRQMAAGDGRVRVFANEINTGVAGARNAIIAAARGEFICFFDDDDVSAPSRVRHQMERLAAYERDFARGAPVVCHTARRLRYADGSDRIARTMGEAEGQAAPSGLAAARRVLAGAPLRGAYGSCATCSQMARTETFRSLGGFDPAFRRGEDTEFFVRMARAGGHFVGIAEPLVTQTMTHGSDKGLEQERLYHLALIDKHRDVFDSESEYDFCRNWAEMKHNWRATRPGAFARQLLALGIGHPVRTLGRLVLALRNLESNRAFRRFHAERSGERV